MEILKLRKNLSERFRKYRPVLIVILAGILLMGLPEQKKEKPPEPATTAEKPDFQHSLEELLSCIQGAGQVKLLLSQEMGPLTVYQDDEDRSETGRRRNTVIVSDRERQEQGLVRQVNPPRYRGAVVLAQGADNPTVRLAIVEAVASAAGLTSDKITVLKMK